MLTHADEHAGELAGGCGLARTVHADNHDHARLTLIRHRLDGAIQLRLAGFDEHLAQHRARLLLALHALGGDALAQGVHDLHRGVGTEVRHEQRVLDFLPGILVQVACTENAEHAATDDVLGLRHAATQLAQAPLNWRDLLGTGGLLLLRRGGGVRNRVYGLVLSRCRSGGLVGLSGLLLGGRRLRGRGWRSRDVSRCGGLLFRGRLGRGWLLDSSLLPLRLVGCLLSGRLILLSSRGYRSSGRWWWNRLLFLRYSRRGFFRLDLFRFVLLSRGLLWLSLRRCRLLRRLRRSLASRLGLLLLLERSRDAHPADIHRRAACILRGRRRGFPARGEVKPTLGLVVTRGRFLLDLRRLLEGDLLGLLAAQAQDDDDRHDGGQHHQANEYPDENVHNP